MLYLLLLLFLTAVRMLRLRLPCPSGVAQCLPHALSLRPGLEWHRALQKSRRAVEHAEKRLGHLLVAAVVGGVQVLDRMAGDVVLLLERTLRLGGGLR